MAKFLLLYSTVDGHTRTICERLVGRIEARGHEVSVVSFDSDGGEDPARFDLRVVELPDLYGLTRSRHYRCANCHFNCSQC